MLVICEKHDVWVLGFNLEVKAASNDGNFDFQSMLIRKLPNVEFIF
ncbi:9874_t:CDS:2, partial [Dentiscutata heterogama]